MKKAFPYWVVGLLMFVAIVGVDILTNIVFRRPLLDGILSHTITALIAIPFALWAVRTQVK